MAQAALARDPGRPAVEFGGIWYGWSDLAGAARQLRAQLAASGIASDAPVGFVARNRPAALAALLALVADGRPIRMIYAFQSPAGMARDAIRSSPAALIADAEDLSPELVSALTADGIAAIALDGMSARAVAGLERARRQLRATPAARHGSKF